jgi:hypothetical protein
VGDAEPARARTCAGSTAGEQEQPVQLAAFPGQAPSAPQPAAVEAHIQPEPEVIASDTGGRAAAPEEGFERGSGCPAPFAVEPVLRLSLSAGPPISGHPAQSQPSQSQVPSLALVLSLAVPPAGAAPAELGAANDAPTTAGAHPASQEPPALQGDAQELGSRPWEVLSDGPAAAKVPVEVPAAQLVARSPAAEGSQPADSERPRQDSPGRIALFLEARFGTGGGVVPAALLADDVAVQPRQDPLQGGLEPDLGSRPRLELESCDAAHSAEPLPAVQLGGSDTAVAAAGEDRAGVGANAAAAVAQGEEVADGRLGAAQGQGEADAVEQPSSSEPATAGGGRRRSSRLSPLQGGHGGGQGGGRSGPPQVLSDSPVPGNLSGEPGGGASSQEGGSREQGGSGLSSSGAGGALGLSLAGSLADVAAELEATHTGGGGVHVLASRSTNEQGHLYSYIAVHGFTSVSRLKAHWRPRTMVGLCAAHYKGARTTWGRNGGKRRMTRVGEVSHDLAVVR